MKTSALCFAVLMFAGSLAQAAPKPNVVLFLVDDMGWMDSTPYGSTYYETPNMERLAKRGLRFTNAYAQPLCSPTRASILTGKYPSRHGILTPSGHQPPQPAGFQFLPDTAPATRAIIAPISKNYLDLSEYTLAEALHDADYRTAHLGKWHLGLTSEYRPNKQGFDLMFESAPDPGPPSYFSPYGVVPEGRPTAKSHVGTITDGPPGEYIVDRLAAEAVKFIRASKDKPFFLNFWSYGVHGPWGHKEEYTKTFAQKKDPSGRQGNPIMASMLRSVDEALGRVIDVLDELKLTDNTVFIFFSDNGGNTHSNTPNDRKTEGKEKGAKSGQLADWRKWAGDLPPTNNTPLRDGKGTLYEGGTRVPLMVMWPGHVPAGVESPAIVHAVDLYPTVLDLLGLKRKDGQIIDGISIAPALRDPQAALPRDAIFNYFPMGGPSKPGGVWVRQGDWKLIRWFETGPEYPDTHELYNLTNDIGEKHNLASEMPDRVKALDAMIDGFLKNTGALAPKPNPAYRPAKSAAAAQARPLGGWVPKSSQAKIKDGALVVTGDGRNPFLGMSNVHQPGPVTMRLLARSGGGPAKVQWRTAAQETFPQDGQTMDFDLAPKGETSVEIPVQGSLRHIRLYLPAQSQPVAIDWIEMKSAKPGVEAQRWDFNE
ncbi:MAG: sulfatase [Prosthecobacter sp.]|nr:sulfatase [Prosthecobacter sp.]